MILIINNQQVNLQGGSGRPNWTFRLKKKSSGVYKGAYGWAKSRTLWIFSTPMFSQQTIPNKTPALDINNSNIKLRHDRSQLDESFAMVCHYGHISTLAISDFCGSTPWHSSSTPWQWTGNSWLHFKEEAVASQWYKVMKHCEWCTWTNRK